MDKLYVLKILRLEEYFTNYQSGYTSPSSFVATFTARCYCNPFIKTQQVFNLSHLKYGGIFKDHFITNLLLDLEMKRYETRAQQ